MSKQKSVSVSIEPTSLADAGYQQARNSDVSRSLAKFVIDRVPSFPDELPDEAKAELYKGYQLRFAENNPDVEYGLVDGNYYPVETLNPDAEIKGKIKVGVGVAMSYTQQAYGALGNDKSDNYNPALKTIIGVWRDKFSKYASNTLKELKAKAKRILNEGKERTRTQALEFDAFITKTFEMLHARCKVAATRGDESANEKRFTAAKIKFMSVWNHQD